MKNRRLGLLLLFAAQFGLFWQYAQREIVWAYPADYDQSTYLMMDYTLYRNALREGLLPAIKHFLQEPHPTGVMLPLQNSLLHFFTGPGRLTDLLLNFLYFVLLEVVFFSTAKWLSGRSVFGWIGCGLLMMQQTVFRPVGALYDCRIDFVTYCLYGIFVCLVVRSDGLREKRWLAAAAGGALLMVSFRFITFAYLLGFCTTLFTALLGLRLLWRRRRREVLVLSRAMWRAAALGGGFLAVGGTLVALNWRFIHDYYVVGHLTGSEKHIRALEIGTTSLASHLAFYLSSLLNDHLGPAFLCAWLALAFLGLGLWFFGRRGVPPVPGRRSPLKSYWLVQLFIIGASLFAPWFILTLDEAKSGVVGGVLAVPATLLVISLVAGFRGRATRGKSAAVVPILPGGAWWRAAAGAVLVLGAFNWLDHLSTGGRFTARKASVDQINALHDFVGETSTTMGYTTPRIGADVIYDWVLPNTINAALYERKGQWLDARVSLGVGIFALTRAQIFTALQKTDIALLTSFPKEGTYPFYDSIRPLEGEIKTWCDAHFLPGRTFDIEGGQVTVYLRPNVPMEGLSGGWITPEGVRLRLSGQVLDWMRASGKGALVLAGGHYPTSLPKEPTVSVQPENPEGQPVNAACPANLTRPEPGTYRVQIDLRALLPAVAAGEDSVITLRLGDAYFVPSDLGTGADTRQLIVTAPTDFLFE